MPTDRQRTACQRTPDFLLELAHAFPFSQFRMIWDLHCHLSGVPGRTPAERIEQLIAFADRMGIERICIFMGLDWSYDPSPEDMRKQNDDVLEALRAWSHRAFGFVYLNPSHVEASLDMAGIEVH